MADAGVGTHGEAVLRLVGLLDLLGVERDVERFEGVEVDGWEFCGNGCGEHALADFWGEVVEGCVVGAVDHFVCAGEVLVNVVHIECGMDLTKVCHLQRGVLIRRLSSEHDAGHLRQSNARKAQRTLDPHRQWRC